MIEDPIVHITFKQYMELTKRFECSYEKASSVLADPDKIKLLHATLGVASESGELAEAVKKHIFYGKPLDFINLLEESGDILWYLARLFEYLKIECPELEIMERNFKKLEARYGEKYSSEKALNRNGRNERLAMGDKI